MGSLEVGHNEIMLFGGFNEGPLDRVLYYKTSGTAHDEGRIETTNNVRLEQKDFFVVNGISIRVPEAVSGGKNQVIVSGHNSVHCFDMDARTFKSLPFT